MTKLIGGVKMLEDLMIAGLGSKQNASEETKEYLDAWISDIIEIEKEYQAKLLWIENILDGSQLIEAIKSNAIGIKSRADIQTIYLETINKQGNKVTTEHGQLIRSTSQKNIEYERVMKNIIKKDEAINLIDEFIFCFNRLERLFRIIIYYSFFKKESALKISQMRLDGHLTYASRTILRKRTEGCEQLMKTLRCAKWLKEKEK